MDVPVAANVLGTLGAVRVILTVTSMSTLLISGVLVNPTHLSDRHQLSSTTCHWITAHNDNALGLGWCSP